MSNHSNHHQPSGFLHERIATSMIFLPQSTFVWALIQIKLLFLASHFQYGKTHQNCLVCDECKIVIYNM